ncbi:YfeK family protein [Desulforhopalus sp. 52FAK]
MLVESAVDHSTHDFMLNKLLGSATIRCSVRGKALCSLLLILLIISSVGVRVVFAKDMSEQVAVEVDQLITFVETSGCQFNRNGKWYDPVEAAKHIAKKYRYVKKKGLVKTTEDFIKYAATKSSMSGKVYTVQCGDAKVVECSSWLNTELARYRLAK